MRFWLPLIGTWIAFGTSNPYRPFTYALLFAEAGYLTQQCHKRSLRLASTKRATAIAESQLAVQQTNLVRLRPYKGRYLQQGERVREAISLAYQHSGGASLLSFPDAQQDYRGIQLTDSNPIRAFLTAASKLNLAAGREVIP
jgi:hypothetical protein